MKSMAFLKNQIQEYDWGSKYFIPGLLSTAVPAKNPQAELWMGAHPKAPSKVLISGRWISLAECIDRNPKGILGYRVAPHFDNKLPFLFKVLAAEKPLSIQAHPDKEQARAGYGRENSLGIPLGADIRNYRDDNHKPELICALTGFQGLKGFRRIEEIIRFSEITGSKALESTAGRLKEHPDQRGLKDFLYGILTMTEGEKRALIGQVIQAAVKHRENDPCFEWIIRLEKEYPGDIGVVSPIFLNLFQLQPGEAIFIPAGELHAYLEGAALEIMANSDNVLRGGLTPKHIDVSELLKIIHFEQSPAVILTPVKEAGNEYFFPRTADEFLLSCIQLTDDGVYEKRQVSSIEIIICIEGRAVIFDEGGNKLNLRKGVSLVVPAGINGYRIQGRATLYKASVPLIE
jgi:mannose-6-phosphate isomerase